MQTATLHSLFPRASMREPAEGLTRSEQVKSAPVARTQGLPAETYKQQESQAKVSYKLRT